ncbi:MAG: M20/M25/M40 family metallo-hydrolase [Pseudomonadota bacterium]
MPQLDTVLARIDQNMEQSIERWLELLRIPSISTDSAYEADCLKAAEVVKTTLEDIGFEASVRPTTGLPMVVGHHVPESLPSDAPHVLFYGHYDVQPADPLDMWTTPPFEPRRVRGEDGIERVYARGAADDKGQMMTFIEASRAWMETAGTLPVKVTVLIEGEEESGSPSLDAFLEENAGELSRDVALICDTNMWDAETPAITTRLRGTMHDELTLIGPSRDLHSGLYGGAALNPIRVLARIVASLHDDDGRVLIPGFYDGVEDVSDQTKAQWDSLNCAPEDFLGDVGLAVPAGESGYSMLEQIWSRPTCDANGIVAGYIDEGTKTVIPSRATVKLSFRLVPGQDPFAIRENLRAYIRAQLPDDCDVEFHGEDGGAALVVPEDEPHLKVAAAALRDEFGRDPVYMGCGGSIPIATSFKDELGMDSLLIGFGLNDDSIHSPNEKYDIDSFVKGTRSWARVLDALAR